jgi:hypothetical protein
MYVGAFCFLAALLVSVLTPNAIHTVHFRVEPLSQGAIEKLPPPQVTINSVRLTPPLKYQVSSEITAIIDVSDAIDSVRDVRMALMEQNGRLKQVDTRVQDARGQLTAAFDLFNKSSSLAVAAGCSGGSHGVPSQYAGEISQLNAAISSNLGGIQTNLATINEKLITPEAFRTP